ncbi:nrdD anaerobic ribonucleoside triphosphate reductase [Pyrococcus abyssi GE5]|uniref:NrdD anaerobic ribonucleoside triphosphate reductase n=2 Tax=Pyrococcus abyssi (strain GE5 / Orsay) TaxID=272844 RepID=Q9V2Q2_PYRAB|nr:nrdD anaerobic ribonucleoside triphosphate reductase [Pyrococcus abyssi GE5]
MLLRSNEDKSILMSNLCRNIGFNIQKAYNPYSQHILIGQNIQVIRMEEVSRDIISEYAKWQSLDVLENANRYPGPSGFFAYVMEEALKDSLNLIPEIGRRAHFSGEIYIHKLPYSLYIPYCTGHSIARLLEKGLKTPTIISRPARHFDTFVDHVANYLITLQHYFSGAQAFSSVEWYAGPFIRKENLDERKIKQNIQRLVYNLNYPTRIGLQTPFTNFTVTLDAPKKMLEGDYAVYDGKKVAPLGEYEEEAKKFFVALTQVLREGDAIGQPFTFPIPTIMVTAKMLWDDPEVFEAVFTTAAKRGSFYWLNTNVVDPDASYAMCCRLNIDKNEFMYAFGLSGKSSEEEALERLERQRFGGLWAMPDVTGSINVTTVNLPRIALKARDDDEFWEEYERVLEIVRITTEWFRDRYISLIRNYPHMYSMITTYLEEFPSSHFNTIGILGLPEAAAIYLNDPKLWIEGSRRDWLEATNIMKEMVEFATSKAREWMRKTGVPWNVEEVPGESAAAKLAIKDARDFPEVKEFLSDPENPIYSTSIAPYYGSLELADRIRIEEKVQRSFTGGVMMHIFLGEEPDPEALAQLTKKLMKTELVYWSYTPAITVCNSCGYSTTGLYTHCPRCGSENVEIWSRIIGYYRPLRNWNPFRKKEFWTRKHYTG